MVDDSSPAQITRTQTFKKFCCSNFLMGNRNLFQGRSQVTIWWVALELINTSALANDKVRKERNKQTDLISDLKSTLEIIVKFRDKSSQEVKKTSDNTHSLKKIKRHIQYTEPYTLYNRIAIVVLL